LAVSFIVSTMVSDNLHGVLYYVIEFHSLCVHEKLALRRSVLP